MNCEEMEYKINLFIDNELDIEEQPELFKHLAGCKECNTFLNTGLKFRKVAKKEEIIYPEILDERILSRLSFKHAEEKKEKSLKMKKSFWTFRLAIPVPALIVILILTILISLLFVKYYSKSMEQYQTKQIEVTKTDYVILQKLPPVEVIGSKEERKTNKKF
jgi:hypothetical protein